MRRHARFSMPSGKGMPQVMPPKILNLCPLQRIAPSLGVDLDDWISFVSKNMGEVISLQPVQHFHSSLIERYKMRPPVLVIGCRPPQMTALPADLLPLQVGDIRLPQTRSSRELRHVGKVLRQL